MSTCCDACWPGDGHDGHGGARRQKYALFFLPCAAPLNFAIFPFPKCAFWGFIFFHFAFLGVHFLSFCLFGRSFSLFWPFGPSFPFISFHFLLAGAATRGPRHKSPKTDRFLIKFKQILSAARPAAFCNFWPFWPSCPFILAFWAFISFHFGLLGLHFLSFWPLGFHYLSFWPFGLSFSFILAFWAFISFHFGLLGRHFSGSWPFGPAFPFILAFCAFISFHFDLLGLHFLSFGRLCVPASTNWTTLRPDLRFGVTHSRATLRANENPKGQNERK